MCVINYKLKCIKEFFYRYRRERERQKYDYEIFLLKLSLMYDHVYYCASFCLAIIFNQIDRLLKKEQAGTDNKANQIVNDQARSASFYNCIFCGRKNIRLIVNVTSYHH